VSEATSALTRELVLTGIEASQDSIIVEVTASLV
jgi:hypothetical protein